MSIGEVYTEKDEQKKAQHDQLTSDILRDVNICPIDGEHKWRLMSWQEKVDHRSHHSIYGGPPLIEMGPRTVNAQLICCCGLTLAYRRESVR